MEATNVRDRGITLTELLISVAIAGIISVVLTGAISIFFRTEGSVTDRIDRSRGVQQLVNYLPADVASSQRIETAPPWTNACLTLGAPILNLAWSETFPGTDPVNVSVTYIKTPDGRQLVRNQCSDGSTSVVALARGIDDARVVVVDIDSGAIEVVVEYNDDEFTVAGNSRNR